MIKQYLKRCCGPILMVASMQPGFAADFEYQYLSIGASEINIEGDGQDLEELSANTLTLSIDVSDRAFLTLSTSRLDADVSNGFETGENEPESDITRLFIGAHDQPDERTSLWMGVGVGRGNFERIRCAAPLAGSCPAGQQQIEKSDWSEARFALGARYWLLPQWLELGTELSYRRTRIEETRSDTFAGLGLRVYPLNDNQLSLSVDYGIELQNGDEDRLELGLRWSF